MLLVSHKPNLRTADRASCFVAFKEGRERDAQSLGYPFTLFDGKVGLVGTSKVDIRRGYTNLGGKFSNGHPLLGKYFFQSHTTKINDFLNNSNHNFAYSNYNCKFVEESNNYSLNKIMETQEVWKPVKDYEGLYEVSNLGRVRDTEKYLIRNGSPSIDMGYILVGLVKDDKTKVKRMHRLVAEAFIPNPEALPFVNHKDQNPSNNRVDNLEWCTSTYNANYKRDSELRKLSQGRQKMVVIMDKSGNEVTRCRSVNEAAEYLGISRGAVSKCLSGKLKSCKKYTFRAVGTFYDDVPEKIKAKSFEAIPKRRTYTAEQHNIYSRKQYANGYYNAGLDAIKYVAENAPELVNGLKEVLGFE